MRTAPVAIAGILGSLVSGPEASADKWDPTAFTDVWGGAELGVSPVLHGNTGWTLDFRAMGLVYNARIGFAETGSALGFGLGIEVQSDESLSALGAIVPLRILWHECAFCVFTLPILAGTAAIDPVLRAGRGLDGFDYVGAEIALFARPQFLVAPAVGIRIGIGFETRFFDEGESTTMPTLALGATLGYP